MKKTIIICLSVLLTACSNNYSTNEPINSSLVSQQVSSITSSSSVSSKPQEEDEIEIVEPVDKSPIITDTVVVTKYKNQESNLENLLGKNLTIVTNYDYERFLNVNNIVIIYDSILLRETPPGMFGVFRFEPLDIIVKNINNKKVTLIHPSNEKHVAEVLKNLKSESLFTPGEQRLMVKTVVDELYPGLSVHGKIGVLTKTIPEGSFIPFLPRGTHTIFNDANKFFQASLDTRIIMYEIDDDLNYPPSRFNKTLNRGEIEGFTHTDGSKMILIRYSNIQRFESYFLDERVLNFNGKYTDEEVRKAFGNRPGYQNSPITFVPSDAPFIGSLSQIDTKLSPLNVCRIEQANKRDGDYTNQKGFPFYTKVPVNGEVNVAILAVDFPDVPGEAEFLPIYQSQIDDLENWSEFVSGGKMKYKVHFPNQWIRAPKEAKFYTTLQSRLDNRQYWDAVITEDLQPTSESIKQILLAADELVDWKVVDFLQILFPLDAYNYGVFVYSHGIDITTPRAGKVNIPVFGDVVKHFTPLSPDPLARTVWDWIAHEVLHFQGIIGHGPHNGAYFGIMMNQHGQTKALLSWESFLMGHFDEQQIACIEPENLTEEVALKLDSLDLTGGQPGIKSLMIPLSKTELVVVEYRTEGPFSILSPELKGFTAYYMDIAKESIRCDSCEPIRMEQLNFWRYLRNDNEILFCDAAFGGGGPINGICGLPSIVQKPGYYLDFNGIRFEFFNDGILKVKRLYN